MPSGKPAQVSNKSLFRHFLFISFIFFFRVKIGPLFLLLYFPYFFLYLSWGPFQQNKHFLTPPFDARCHIGRNIFDYLKFSIFSSYSNSKDAFFYRESFIAIFVGGAWEFEELSSNCEITLLFIGWEREREKEINNEEIKRLGDAFFFEVFLFFSWCSFLPK